MSEGHPRDVDPVTGYDTTGHDWNGIRELNTPFPKFVIWILAATVAYSIVAWILLPAWPTGRDYTRGLLGLDQGEMAVAGLSELSADAAGLARALRPGRLRGAPVRRGAPRHGDARGRPPLRRQLRRLPRSGRRRRPRLPGPERRPLALGRRSGEPSPRRSASGSTPTTPTPGSSQMPPFDWLARDERLALAAWVAALPQGVGARRRPRGRALRRELRRLPRRARRGRPRERRARPQRRRGASPARMPESIAATLLHGRQGVMPAWSGRLSEAEINLLALHVTRLGGETQEAAR